MQERRRILIATDAWSPQVNGVVRTLETTVHQLRSWGHIVEVVSPEGYRQLPVPFYPEIRLALPWPHQLNHRVRSFQPDHLHIATEGPIGWLVRRFCTKQGWKFTTSYHTRFPEYLEQMARVPASASYRVMRRFHNAAARVMVATPSLETELNARGFTSPKGRWSRGVDLTLFQPQLKQPAEWPRPLLLYVGRVSVEKGIEDFLKLNLPGTKIVVGDGPARPGLEKQFPDAKFLGYRRGAALAATYAQADLFVFPSRTDTFGIVLIEALACGLPVAGYPVTGPIDIITRPTLGVLDENLEVAARHALVTTDPVECVQEAQKYTWPRSSEQFLSHLVPCR
ncbi:MAG: glycosyltransferase family 4 protein [Gemmataceae bacterium]